MPGLIESIPDTSSLTTVTSKIGDVATFLAGLTGKITALSLDKLSSTATGLTGLPLPGLSDAAGIIPSSVLNIKDTITGELSSAVTDPGTLFTGIKAALSDDLLKKLEPVLSQLAFFNNLKSVESMFNDFKTQITSTLDLVNQLKAGNSPDFSAIINNASSFFDAFALFDEIEEIKRIKPVINLIKTWGASSPLEIGNLLKTAFESLKNGFEENKTGLTLELDNFKADFEIGLMDTINSKKKAVTDSINQLIKIDFTKPSNWTAAVETVHTFKSRLAEMIFFINDKTANTLAVIDNLNNNVLFDKINAVIFSTREFTGSNVLEEGVRNFLASMVSLFSFNTENLSTQINSFLEPVNNILNSLDFSVVEQPIQEAVEKINGFAAEVETVKTNFITKINESFTACKTKIESIDLDSLMETYKGIINTFKNDNLKPLTDSISSVSTALTDLITELSTSLEGFNLTDLTAEAAAQLTNITNMLKEIDTGALLDDIKAIPAELDAVTLKPIFDEVLAKIDGITVQAKSIDTSKLNAAARLALAAAMEIIKQIDFQELVVKPVTDEFNKLSSVPFDTIEQIRSRCNVLEDKLKAFNPASLILPYIEAPFNEFTVKLNSIMPSLFLKPLLASFQSMVDKLNSFSLSKLVEPLNSFKTNLLSYLNGDITNELFSPLEQGLAVIKGYMANLDPSQWLADVSEYLQKITGLAGGLPFMDRLGDFTAVELKLSELIKQFDPAVIEASLISYIDALLALLDNIDITPIAAVTSGIHGIFDDIPINRLDTVITGTMENIGNMARAIDITAIETAISAGWQQVNETLAAQEPPDNSKDIYQELKTLLSAYNPADNLSGIMPAVLLIKDNVETLTLKTTNQFNNVKESFTAQVAAFNEALPAPLTMDFIKSILKQTLVDSIVKPVIELLTQVKEQESELLVLIQPVDEIIAKIYKVFKYIVDPLSVLKPITEALDGVKKKLLDLNLDALKNELDSLITTVKDKIDELDFTKLTQPLDAFYTQFLDELRSLFTQEMIDRLDLVFKEGITDKITDIDLKKLLEPVATVYNDLLAILKPFSMDELIKPVADLIERVFTELDDGLEKTGEAFKNMLTSIPV